MIIDKGFFSGFMDHSMDHRMPLFMGEYIYSIIFPDGSWLKESSWDQDTEETTFVFNEAFTMKSESWMKICLDIKQKNGYLLDCYVEAMPKY